MRPTRLVVLLALLVAPTLPAAAATTVLDAMTGALPANGCLPSAQPVVFLGPFCDAPSCPPGSVVSPSDCPGLVTAWVEQTGIAGVPAGVSRRVAVDGGTVDAGVSARIDPVSAVTVFDEGPVVRGLMSLEYFPAPGSAWRLDLAALGAVSVHAELAGEISATAPVHARLVLTNYDDAGSDATCEGMATAPGTLVFPISSFTVSPGFDFSSVAQVELVLFDCDPCGAPVQPRQYTLGPLVFDSDVATTARASSWGRLKATYR